MSSWSDRLSRLSARLAELGVRDEAPFEDDAPFVEALTHSSWTGEHGGVSNERLEFLGDAVLDLLVGELLFRLYPAAGEGTLTKARASLVDERALAARARLVGLGELLAMGRGADFTSERQRPSVLSGAFEALVAALYLTEGLDGVRRLVESLFVEEARELGSRPAPRDYKTLLQKLTQERWRLLPVYSVVRVTGPDHAKTFEVEVAVHGEVQGRGEGTTKKAAEQQAARSALEALSGH